MRDKTWSQIRDINKHIPRSDNSDGYSTLVSDGYSHHHIGPDTNIKRVTNNINRPVAIQNLGIMQNGYVLTWNATDGYYVAAPVNNSLNHNYFSNNGTWTCPDNVTNILVIGAGGGQGGGGGSPTGSGQGGAGSLQATAHVPVVPGTTYNIIIGAGGFGNIGSNSAVSAPTNGSPTMIQNGSSTIFSVMGAAIMTGLSFIGSLGGTINGLNGANGTVNFIYAFTGGIGGTGSSLNGNAYGGGGGGAGPQGNGGNGGAGNSTGNGSNGSDAIANSSAGGGGNGGNGGPGYLYIIY